MKSALSICVCLFLATAARAADPAAETGMPAAEQAIAGKNWQQGAGLLLGVTQQEPEHARAFLLLGYCRMMLGEHAAALESYRTSAGLSPTLDAFSGWQWAALTLGQARESIAPGEQALALNPSDYWVRMRLARARAMLGDFTAAEAGYAAVAETFPADAEACWGAGLAAWERGDRERAYDWFTRGRRIDPGHAGLRESLGLPASPDWIGLSPFFSSTSFGDTALKSASTAWGATARWAWSDYWSIDAGYKRTSTTVSNGATSVTSLVGASVAHVFPRGVTVSGGAWILAGDDAWSDGAVLVSAGLQGGGFRPLDANLALLAYPRHTGWQADADWRVPFGGTFVSRTKLTGQLVSFQSGGRPFFYGAVSQSLAFTAAPFTIGAGGRLGTLYTPLLEGVAVFNTEELGAGFSLFLELAVSGSFSLHAAWHLDSWSNTLGESPYSSQLSFQLQARFP